MLGSKTLGLSAADGATELYEPWRKGDAWVADEGTCGWWKF